MRLDRALGKFSDTPVWVWDPTAQDWYETGSKASLHAFDRFITERSFGQKKRILTLDRANRLPEYSDIIKLGDSSEVFLLEKENEDIRQGRVYGYTYLLREANYHGTVRQETLVANAAGIPLRTETEDLFEAWLDVERFTSAASRLFEESEITLVTLTFARGTQISTDMYIDIDNGGGRYNVDEVHETLDLVTARGKRIGP